MKGGERMIRGILIAIVRDLKERGVLTEVLETAKVDPFAWMVFKEECRPFEDNDVKKD